MTLSITELITYARQQYNAVGDTFFSDDEARLEIYQAQMELAKETKCIRSVFTTTSVSSQQTYAFPTAALEIKRVTFNGDKVRPDSLENVLDLTSSTGAATGTPYIYAIWNETLYFGPIPNAAQTIQIFSINEPGTITSSATALEVPSRYQAELVEFVLWKWCLKDKNYQGATLHQTLWQKCVDRAKAYERLMLRGNGFSIVRNEDMDFQNWRVL